MGIFVEEGSKKIYVNKETYEVCYAYDRESMIADRANDLMQNYENFEKVISKFSRTFIFNMPEKQKAFIRGTFERECWTRAEREFNDNWVESELS